MKSNSSDSDLQGDEKATRKRVYEPPKKIIFTGNMLTQKNNISSDRQDVMKNICESILKSNQKLKSDQIQEEKYSKMDLDKVEQYNPHLIYGKVQNYRECTQSDKNQYNLDFNKGQQFQLQKTYLVIVSGQIGYSFSNGVNVNLYIPKRILDQKDPKMYNGKQIILIKRQTLNNNSDCMNYPYVVIEPALQLYPTYLCSWIECKRLITIQNYIQADKQVNQSMVFGNACHRYMQWLINKQADISANLEQFKQTAVKIYNSFLYDMYLINAKFQNFFQYCKKGLTNIRMWVKNHIVDQKQIQVNKYKKIYLKIYEIVGSQIMHRSKYFGLKGKTDCLLKGVLLNKMQNTSTQVYIPFQLKTGQRVSQSHKKQTDMYCLLIREMYKKNVIGLLYYSQTNTAIFRDESPQISFQMVVIHRNWIVMNLLNLYKDQKVALPKFNTEGTNCSRCKMTTICESLHMIIKEEERLQSQKQNSKKINEKNNKDDQEGYDSDDQLFNAIKSKPIIGDIQDLPSRNVESIKQSLNNITNSQYEYLRKWIRWLHMEQFHIKKINQKCQKQGFSNFYLKTTQFSNIMAHNNDIKLRFWICKQNQSLQSLNGLESVYIVSQKLRIFINHLGVIQGCKITDVKRMKNSFFMQMQMNNNQINLSKKKLNYFINQNQDIDVELQRFENNFFSTLRNTVYQLVLGDDQELKKLVIQNKKHVNLELQQKASQDNKKNCQQVQITEDDLGKLNSDQTEAFKKSISCQRFTLIEGMPGTGKTQLILRMTQKFDKLGKKVLITSFTNRSLDNILERIVQSNKIDLSKVIRQGSRYSVKVQHKGMNPRQQTFQTLQDYQQYFSSKTIWLVTLSSLSIHHIPENFDVVILDEASQCLQPVCLDALKRTKKFILIGDYKQLQPVIKSEEAIKEGMNISLFEKLCKSFPSEVIALKKQYRMNKQIMKISNKLVYNGELELGSETVSKRILKLASNWQQSIKTQDMTDLIDPKHPVRFLNYDGVINALSKNYRSQEQNIKTVLEVEFSCYLYKKFIELGVQRKDIAIISVYNLIVQKITNLLIKKKLIQSNNGTILTIDKSQGIDKEVIILLAHKRQNNNLIENPRRLNVALTRSKCKLIVIGSQDFLKTMKVWEGDLGNILNQYRIDISRKMIDQVLAEFQE